MGSESTAKSGVPEPAVGSVDRRLIEAGIFLVDKPSGPTSFWIVKQIRRVLRIKKVGHAGTLDPMASGLLVICAGRPATRIIERLMVGEKEYVATLRLGIETDTLDREGEIIAERPVPEIDRTVVEGCLATFVGEQMQTPPRFSALKHKGKPLYYYARRGIEVVKEPRPVEIKSVECLDLDHESLTIRVVCGKGTYIRTLAADIGNALGCGAHLTELRRTRSGPFSVSDCLPGAALADSDLAPDLLRKHLITVDEALGLL